ncbi:MAG TPA: hypothetical protein VNH43_11030 [Vicinamibacteria bacterium]|nr:hypothetical protein [Vicinamibacteria bacterium]
MKTIGVGSRVGLFVSAVVLAVQISPARAGGEGGTAGNTHHSRVEVTFTKWITAFPLMAGFTGGDVAGDFVGEVLDRKVSANLLVTRLVAIYEVQAGDHSFTALIQGGQNNPGGIALGGKALLDGFILTGWRTGARVHVEYVQMENCDGAPAGRCFEGTITIERAED